MWKRKRKRKGENEISPNQMDKICVWNIRRLNSPRKQKVMREFLAKYYVGLVGLLETKVKATWMGTLYQVMFQNWGFTSNSSYHK